MPRWTPTFLTELRRTARWHRKLLAAGLAAAAVTVGIEAASAPDPSTTSMTVAAGALSGGTTLQQEDLTTVEVSPDAVPESAVTVEDAVGAVLAGPIGPGEPLSSTRLLGASLLEGWGPDLVASPVRIADAGSVGVLTVGDRIDLLASTGSGEASVLSEAVPVLAVPSEEDSGVGSAGGALVVVAVAPAEAASLADAATRGTVSFSLRDS
ncbi:MAG TPA: RcpC/CpaB family pilus assembly protein [Jiangellaceae bacterium]|nr:RcpC/CpaB family pilus assembly protein [Jiangellaceae bacterium]